jgi:hypothetical protein
MDFNVSPLRLRPLEHLSLLYSQMMVLNLKDVDWTFVPCEFLAFGVYAALCDWRTPTTKNRSKHSTDASLRFKSVSPHSAIRGTRTISLEPECHYPTPQCPLATPPRVTAIHTFPCTYRLTSQHSPPRSPRPQAQQPP